VTGQDGRVVAGIDCGTNSTRLLVSRSGSQTLDRVMTITRLGQGVDATGRLDPVAVDRTLSTLQRYREVMDRHGVEATRITATSAARDASNRDEFFDAAAKIVGARPELLDGDSEARLSFLGATRELDPADGPFLVIDIGGGSTEFAVGASQCNGAISVDIGCVRLTERFLQSDPPSADELSAAISVVDAYLDDVVRDVPATRDAAVLVGLAGTITTVAAVEIGLPAYNRDAIHHFRLTREAAEDVFRTLATETRAERIHNPGLEEARADVIVGGCCILVAIMRFFGFGECLVSESDILDGLVLSQIDTD